MILGYLYANVLLKQINGLKKRQKLLLILHLFVQLHAFLECPSPPKQPKILMTYIAYAYGNVHP